MRQQVLAFCECDDGATAIEYTFIASLVAVAGFATIANLGEVINLMFGTISDGVNNAVASSIGNG